MRALISGSSGLIGTALRFGLIERGHDVVRLVRREPAAEGELRWDPGAGILDPEDVAGFDAVVNLNGVSIGEKRWTVERKEAIRTSRIDATRLLAEALAATTEPPGVLVSASAIGVYGDRGAEELDESSPIGPRGEFLVDVVVDWEAATEPASVAGIRVVHARNGIVLAREGGILPRMALPFRLGAGGRIGDGSQWMSWIHIDDVVSAIVHLIDAQFVSGTVNVTSPDPVTNALFTRTLGAALRRPTFLPVPRVALDVLYGRELVDALLYASTRVRPAVLEGSGFSFAHPKLDGALRVTLGR